MEWIILSDLLNIFKCYKGDSENHLTMVLLFFSVSEISANDVAEHKFIPLTVVPQAQLIL